MSQIGYLKRLFLYGALSREDYKKIDFEINESNRKNTVVYSCIMGIIMLIMIPVSRFVVSFRDMTGLYAVALAGFIALLLVNRYPARKHRVLIRLSVVLFMAVILAIGIYMAVVSGVNERTTMYLVFMLVVSFCYTVRPITITAMISASFAAYLSCIIHFQSGDLLHVNAINSTLVCVGSMMAGVYMMVIKLSKYHSARLNRYLMQTDQMTGMPNRRSYEEELARLRNTSEPYSIAILDANNLKTTNDNIGHSAGDELICAAAECIVSVFGKYGLCFRIGGDEFAAVIHDFTRSTEELRNDLIAATAKYHLDSANTLSISCGMCSSDEADSREPETLVRIADRRMYEDKAEYYLTSGIDRRTR